MAERLPAAGWYDDPSTPRRLRYWDGSEWTGHVAARPADMGPGPSTNVMRAGLLVLAMALVAMGACIVLAVVTANACGPLADGCEDYGKPTAGFELFVSGAVSFAGVAVVGLAIVLLSPFAGRRRR